MLCANTEGVFRLIQSIPSPKAEPFKRWLAKVGEENQAVGRCQETAQEGLNKEQRDDEELGNYD